MASKSLTDFPTIRLTLLLGLLENEKSRWKYIQRVYKFVVISAFKLFENIQFACAARRFYQQFDVLKTNPKPWKDLLFEPELQLIFLNVLFFTSGGISALIIHLIHTGDFEFIEELRASIDNETYTRCFILMLSSVIYSLIIAISGFLVYIHPREGIPYTAPLIGKGIGWRILEAYMYFLCQIAMNLLVASFVQAAQCVQKKIQTLLAAIEENIAHISAEDVLLRIRKIQRLHFDVISAKERLQEKYNFALFYVYAISIPALCFMVFLMLKNHKASTAFLISLSLWTLTNIGALLFMSFSAFNIHEKSELLVAASIKMYNRTLSNFSNVHIISRTTLLLYQIQTTKLTLSACGYFKIKKKILLTLFSSILTNFLILVQFSKDSFFQ